MQKVSRECEETKQRVEREAVESLLKLKAQLESQKEDKRQLERERLRMEEAKYATDTEVIRVKRLCDKVTKKASEQVAGLKLQLAESMSTTAKQVAGILHSSDWAESEQIKQVS
jgi:hypothetical protein